MPLYTIKHLKAPWPAGARVGDVIEFDQLPAWALGKAELGGTQATVFAGGSISGDGSGTALPAFDPDPGDANITTALAEAEAQALDQRRVILTLEARKMGIRVDGRWSADRLTEEIQKAQAAQ